MSKAQIAFEAMMRVGGNDKLTFKNGKYINPTTQIRWRWFQTGWELRGLS